jgi:hypothetical protein
MGRDRNRGTEPRWISQHLEGAPTPRASELVEATPESNVGGGGTIVVESTRTAPGGVATVLTTDELAAHTDDDSHLVVDPVTGEAELVEIEPVEPLVRDAAEPVEGAPAGSPPAPRDAAGEVVELEPEPVDNGPGSEGSLTVDPSSPVPGELGERPDDAEPGIAVATATAGKPGSYSPELEGADRPGTLLELGDRVTPSPDTAWPEGSWIPYGSGKRAHYGPDGWHTGESPGYPSA